jgi:replicative DNA helicase
MDDIPPPLELPSTEIPAVPYSREAEEAVLGAILINPEAYYDVAPFLKGEDFYIQRYRWIWEAFTALHERRAPLDFLTLSDELEQKGQLEEIGGPAFLSSLVSNVPTSLHAEAYGHIIEANAIRRHMLDAANQIAKLAHEEAKTIENVLDESEKPSLG